MSTYLKQYIQIYTLNQMISFSFIWLAIIGICSKLFLMILAKKIELRNALLNTSYSKISDWILNLTKVSMISFAVSTMLIMGYGWALKNAC